jgi:hypothetical protein
MTMNATCMTTTAATTLLAKQLTAAESVVVQATSHLELMCTLVNQACTVANEVTQGHAVSHKTLAATCCVRAMAIDTVDITTGDKLKCVAELNALDMSMMVSAKNQLALGAQTIFESATRTHKDAVNTLNSLHERTMNVNAPDDGGFIRTQGTTATLCSTSTTSTTPMVAMVKVTPGSILLGNDFR